MSKQFVKYRQRDVARYISTVQTRISKDVEEFLFSVILPKYPEKSRKGVVDDAKEDWKGVLTVDILMELESYILEQLKAYKPYAVESPDNALVYGLWGRELEAVRGWQHQHSLETEPYASEVSYDTDGEFEKIRKLVRRY